MKHRTLISLLVLLCTAAVSSAVEVAGVTLPPTVTIEGKTLHLNGAGFARR
jgi:hypothetical protein